MFEKGETRYYIKLPSGKYYAKEQGESIIETRIIDYANYYQEKNDALKKAAELDPDATIIKRKRIPVSSYGEKVDEKFLKNGVELERKYAVACGKESGYMFTCSHNSKTNSLYNISLLEFDVAEKLAKELEAEELKERTKRIKWDVLEVATIEEEVTI